MAAAALARPGRPAAEAPPEPVLTRRRVLAFVVMVFGMFMAILDIQIVSASLREIQAGLGASSSEIAWVQTGYLIAEVVMIPLSGFLARMMGTRLLFAVSAGGFTAASLLCATSGSLPEIVLWRAVQGFLGGGMIPSVFAAAFTIFPASKRPIVSPLIGLVATLAPTVGPTVGGYLSDTFSWHWLFLVNVGPGILVTAGALLLIDFDRPDWRLWDHFDWLGLAALAAFLGGLEYVLEEGPGGDWFSDRWVAVLALVSALGAATFFWRALTREEPIVDLTALGNANFAVGSLFSFVMGVGLYGLTYLYPLFLGSVRGYDSLMIGQTMFVSGLAMMVAAPVTGVLSRRLDLRVMLMAGFVGFAVSTWWLTAITAEWDFTQLLWPQVLRGLSLMTCMVSINNLALGTLPPSRIRGASGLYNLMRNLGGAVGLAAINTLLTDREALHVARLSDSVSWTNAEAVRQLDALSRTLGSPRAALAQLALRVQAQAAVMSFADVFLLITARFGGLAAAALLVRPPRAGAGGAGH